MCVCIPWLSRFVHSKHPMVGYFIGSSSVSGVATDMSTNDASDEESSDEGVCTSLESGEVLPASNNSINSIIDLHTFQRICVHTTCISILLCDTALSQCHYALLCADTKWFGVFSFQQGHTSMVSCPPPPPQWPQGSRKLVEWVPLHHMLTSVQLQCMTTDRESLPSQDGHQRRCTDNLYIHGSSVYGVFACFLTHSQM